MSRVVSWWTSPKLGALNDLHGCVLRLEGVRNPAKKNTCTHGWYEVFSNRRGVFFCDEGNDFLEPHSQQKGRLAKGLYTVWMFAGHSALTHPKRQTWQKFCKIQLLFHGFLAKWVCLALRQMSERWQLFVQNEGQRSNWLVEHWPILRHA